MDHLRHILKRMCVRKQPESFRLDLISWTAFDASTFYHFHCELRNCSFLGEGKKMREPAKKNQSLWWRSHSKKIQELEHWKKVCREKKRDECTHGKNGNLWKKRMLTKLSITILPSTCARTRWFEWIGRSWLSVYKCTHQSKHDRADATMWNRRFSFHLRSVALPFLKTALHTRPLHRMWNFKHKEWRRRRRNETIRRLRNPGGEWKKERKTNKKRTNVHICSSPNKTDFGLVKTTIYL